MWTGDEYHYGIALLRGIAENYYTLYDDGIWFVIKSRFYYISPNDFTVVAEYKADFDNALKSLSRRQGEIVRADIKGIPDGEMEQKGFYNIEKFKWMAYSRMAGYLNGKLDLCRS